MTTTSQPQAKKIEVFGAMFIDNELLNFDGQLDQKTINKVIKGGNATWLNDSPKTREEHLTDAKSDLAALRSGDCSMVVTVNGKEVRKGTKMPSGVQKFIREHFRFIEVVEEIVTEPVISKEEIETVPSTVAQSSLSFEKLSKTEQEDAVREVYYFLDSSAKTKAIREKLESKFSDTTYDNVYYALQRILYKSKKI